MARRILIADDSDATLESLATLLQDDRWTVETVSDGRTALEKLTTAHYSLFITDLKMPQLEGMQIIERLSRQKVPTSVIVMTGYGSIDQAVQAMRLGACDFLPKPVDPDHLRFVIDRVLRDRSRDDELTQLREQVNNQYSFQNILSKSPRMLSVFELITSVAQTNTTVLVEGETGTGKEQVARAIHAASQSHRTGEFVAVNCAALPENLLESELFGHEKGAFTNAVSQRRGRFELAHGGTIFLDEAGDIPASMQAKLLRVLQERRFERVGGTQAIEVDVRVVAATNRNLARMVKQNKFREDLYYRLNVVKLDLPPLRERAMDIPLLATHFCFKYARPGESPKRIAPDAMEKLISHPWPGNIRELENAIERACVTARGPEIVSEDLPLEVLQPRGSSQSGGRPIDLNKPLPQLLEEMRIDVEKQYIRRALKKARGNVGRCAKLCGLSRRSISAKLAEYNIEKREFKSEA